MYLDEYLKQNIIENKFINLLNTKNYDASLKLLCENKKENFISLNATSFKINDKLLVKDNFLKKKNYKYKIFFQYKTENGETIKDYFYIKNYSGKRCITKK